MKKIVNDSQTELALEKLKHCEKIKNELWEFINELNIQINKEKNLTPNTSVCIIIEIISAFEKLHNLQLEVFNIGNLNLPANEPSCSLS